MTDEFDELLEPENRLRDRRVVRPSAQAKGVPAARLVSRLYRTAEPSLRVRLLNCLLKPLGTLALAGVAAGAFAQFVHRSGAATARAAFDDVAQYSNDQLMELARFVEQVSPEALRDFTKLMSDHPVGMAAFSASTVMLLARKLGRKKADAPYGSDDRA
jgi:hypothetical protein